MAAYRLLCCLVLVFVFSNTVDAAFQVKTIDGLLSDWENDELFNSTDGYHWYVKLTSVVIKKVYKLVTFHLLLGDLASFDP
jgi:hypothetical protein